MKKVQVTSVVNVTIDESKFTSEFMQEFRESYYPFKTIDDHIQHLGQMYARGLYSEIPGFIEGYGPANEMGISFSTDRNAFDVEIVK